MPRFSATVLVALSFGVAAYAWIAYGLFPLGVTVHPDMRASFTAHPLTVYLHVFGAAVALLVGPFQFSSRLRARRPRLHRRLGRIYLGVGVALGGVAGLFLAAGAYGGLAGKLGFASLAIAWLYTGVHALGAAQSRDFVAHRRWMMRNFALSFAAVTLRLWLPASQAWGIPFESAYPAIAWLCWLPNLMVTEWLIARGPARAARARA